MLHGLDPFYTPSVRLIIPKTGEFRDLGSMGVYGDAFLITLKHFASRFDENDGGVMVDIIAVHNTTNDRYYAFKCLIVATSGIVYLVVLL